MHVTTVVSWLGMCLPTAWLHMGPWALTLGLLFTALLVYIGFRERYLFIWLAGWGCLLLSRGAMNSTALANHHAALALEKILFVLAITLLSASALYYTDSRRYLPWIGVLGSLDVCVAAAHAIWFPSSYPVSVMFSDPVPLHRSGGGATPCAVCNWANGIWTLALWAGPVIAAL